jgi:hypothetical protein
MQKARYRAKVADRQDRASGLDVLAVPSEGADGVGHLDADVRLVTDIPHASLFYDLSTRTDVACELLNFALQQHR